MAPVGTLLYRHHLSAVRCLGDRVFLCHKGSVVTCVEELEAMLVAEHADDDSRWTSFLAQIRQLLLNLYTKSVIQLHNQNRCRLETNSI